ncbi:FKBP12-interacting protein of 37 kDa-like [Senna tora]|uniref:FKBP12-interacting protein of 37 kDa-like n=1 Tax=Senna tora TaxID=362788 RepID=A0A834SLP4_9FABA|nr:FKBP12-interacting protein of 37 kDa-like [Senna tora]
MFFVWSRKLETLKAQIQKFCSLFPRDSSSENNDECNRNRQIPQSSDCSWKTGSNCYQARLLSSRFRVPIASSSQRNVLQLHFFSVFCAFPILRVFEHMASPAHFDDEFDFEGGLSGRHSGNKRSSPDYDDEDYDGDPFASKKHARIIMDERGASVSFVPILKLAHAPLDGWGSLAYVKSKAEEAAPGVTTGMILSLRESLQNCKDSLATCQNDLEAAKSEIQKWRLSFENEPFIPAGATPEPKLVINYLQALKSSEESFREQLEKAKKKEAAFIVTFAKREQEIAELKSAVRDLRAQLKPPSMQTRRLLLDPAVHEEFTRLKNLVEEKDKKVKELQDNIAAVNFTPQSKMGKMLMAKCRTLQEENEEIGNQASEGKMHELALKLALQKSQNGELRSQFEVVYSCGSGNGGCVLLVCCLTDFMFQVHCVNAFIITE